MARTTLGSLLDREFRNELNRMLTELYDAVGFITEGTITPEMIANGSITGNKIANGSIYGDKIANNSIEDGKLKENTVGRRELKDGSVNNAKLGVRAVAWNNIDEGAVTSSRVADHAINERKLSVSSFEMNRGKVFPFRKTNSNETLIFNDGVLDLKVHNAGKGALYKIVQLSKNGTAFGSASTYITFDKSINGGSTWQPLIQRLHAPLDNNQKGIKEHLITRPEIDEVISIIIDWEAIPDGTHNVSMTGAEYLVNESQHLYHDAYEYPSALSLEKTVSPRSGKYVEFNTGIVKEHSSFNLYEKMKVTPGLKYIIEPLNQFAWYDKHGKHISGGSGQTTSNPVVAPPDAHELSVSVSWNNMDKIKIYQSDVDLPFVHLTNSEVNKVKQLNLDNLEQSTNIERLYNISEIFHAWESGEKFPIAFVDDSQTAGTGTTGYIPNELGTDNQSPYAYPKILQNKMRELSHSNNLRVYNAGFSGKSAKWMNDNFEAEFGAGTPYSDTKIAFVGFGTNDRLSQVNPKTYYDSFKTELEALIDKFIQKGIQPVLMTEQPIIAPGVSEEHKSSHPLRTAGYVNAVSNKVKFDLAEEYNLEVVDLNNKLSKVMKGIDSPLSTIYNGNDGLHFGDNGHVLVRDVFASVIYPYTNAITDYGVIDLTHQNIHKGVPENKVDLGSAYGYIKGHCDYPVSSEELLLKTSIYIDDYRNYNLYCYKCGDSSTVRIKINGNALTTPNSTLDNKQVVAELTPGYHEIEVLSGASQAGFRGLLLEPKNYAM